MKEAEIKKYYKKKINELKNHMRGNAFIDLRNIYERNVVEAVGFDYSAVGR